MSRLSLALLLIPLVFAACSQNNVTVDDSLQKYFDSVAVKGTFGFFDNGQGHFTICNLPRFRDSAFAPGATFDIIQSLIAIQTGVVKDDSLIIQDFRSSVDTGGLGFRELAARIGKDTLKKWIDSLGYGNKYIAGDAFWYDNRLKITPDEQLGLMKKLYFGQLPFFQRTQKMVVDMMASEGNANYQLHYKAARGIGEDGHVIGWVLGWVEENKHPYFFVVNLESADPSADLPAKGLSIARGILSKMGFFQGKK